VADDVNEALSGLSPSDLPDIESDDEGDGEKQENSDEDDDSDEEDEEDAEEGAAGGAVARSAPSGSKGAKKDRHFWQYNVQAKGPKGQKIVVPTRIDDPHVLNDIVDPVFSDEIHLQGIKHRCAAFILTP